MIQAVAMTPRSPWILDFSVPSLDRHRGPQETSQLMQEESGIIAAEEVLEHLLSLALTTLHVNGLEDGDDVFEEEFGIVCPPPCHSIST